MDRLSDLVRFYTLIDILTEHVGGARSLSQCDGYSGWPTRGVYFFFEPGELRSHSGRGSRVVRVGTHALTATSRANLWSRLSQHRGTKLTGGGNHRGSIFRLLVGAALQRRLLCQPSRTWGKQQDIRRAAQHLGSTVEQLRATELPIEIAVSQYIGSMPFVWLSVPDPPGPTSRRAVIERGAIALLSNGRDRQLDPPSPDWLGTWSDREQVRRSGLWNVRHVDGLYDPAFLDILEEAIRKLSSQPRPEQP
jgi:hypothetical protein